MIKHPNNYVAFKIVLFVFLGALCAYQNNQTLFFGVIAALLLLWLTALFLQKKLYQRFCFFAALFMSFGFVYVQVDKLFVKDSFVRQEYYSAQVLETERSLVKRDKLIVEIQGVPNNVIVYLPSVDKIDVGDTLVFTKHPFVLFDIKNPNEFNYKNYLNRKGVSFSLALDTSDYMLKKSSLSLLKKAPFAYLRNTIEQKIRPYLSEETAPLIFSVVLGDRTELSTDVKQTFSRTGLMHLLAVSGLHLGIFIGVFRYLLKRKKVVAFISPKWRFVFLLAILWFYALLTGFSPSIQRASVMFSFLLLHDVVPHKNKNSLNLLALSALVLFVINPYCLQEVGFQYSYCAVIGIVCLANPILKAVYIPTKLARWFWELMVVSFAAQLFTTPLALYYFGSFPNYFLLSNVLVLPLGIALVIVGALCLFTLFITPLVPYTTLALDYLAQAILYLATQVNNLPKAFSYLPLYKAEMLLGLSFLVFLIVALAKRSKWSILVCCFVGLNTLLLVFFPLKLSILFMSIKSDVVYTLERNREVVSKPILSDNKPAKYAYFFSKPAEELISLDTVSNVLYYENNNKALVQIGEHATLFLKDSLSITPTSDYLVLSNKYVWSKALENYKGTLLINPHRTWDSLSIDLIKQKMQAKQLVDLRAFAFEVNVEP